jgi:hypothetical protein
MNIKNYLKNSLLSKKIYLRHNIGVNKIPALCDLGASVSSILKSLFDRLNLGSFKLAELKLHLVDSTYKQAVSIRKHCCKH